jgi:hypothetical protein
MSMLPIRRCALEPRDPDFLRRPHETRWRIAGKSRTFATEVMIHPLYLGICDAILGPSCASYQLNLAHLIARGPGAEHQYLHRDELVWNPTHRRRGRWRVPHGARRAWRGV